MGAPSKAQIIRLVKIQPREREVITLEETLAFMEATK